LTRGGFFSPSLDGGLLLFVLSNPSRRSSSAMRALSAAISDDCAATSVISSSLDGSDRESNSGFIESLNRNPIPPSRKIYRLANTSPPGQLLFCKTNWKKLNDSNAAIKNGL
jgi:hypothetical protein